MRAIVIIYPGNQRLTEQSKADVGNILFRNGIDIEKAELYDFDGTEIARALASELVQAQHEEVQSDSSISIKNAVIFINTKYKNEVESSKMPSGQLHLTVQLIKDLQDITADATQRTALRNAIEIISEHASTAKRYGLPKETVETIQSIHNSNLC